MMINEVFQRELLKGEHIVWSGQPDASVVFTKADIFLVPFSVLWGGFAIFWEASVLFMKDNAGRGAPTLFSFVGVPFVLVGIYFIFGRFVYKKIKKQRTYYAVTNKRVLALTRLSGEQTDAMFIRDIPVLNKTRRSNGNGTITFGGSSLISSMYGNTGMEFLAAFYGKPALVFYDINDVNRVYDIVNELRNKE